MWKEKLRLVQYLKMKKEIKKKILFKSFIRERGLFFIMWGWLYIVSIRPQWMIDGKDSVMIKYFLVHQPRKKFFCFFSFSILTKMITAL